MSFIHDDFLLTNPYAVRLYHEFARDEPILDFHNHLSPKEIAEDRRFNNLAEIWLEGDHYKWRALRANGIPEELVTGNGDPKKKYLAWAATIPHTLGNPLYHWTHLELKRCFDIDLLLSPETAENIWDQANEKLQNPISPPEVCSNAFKSKHYAPPMIRPTHSPIIVKLLRANHGM